MELLSLIKRKSRNSSSDSSSNSPEFKRRREEQEVLDILTIPEDAEAEESDIVLTALHMAQNFASKADEILAKLTQLDAITLQMKLLQNSVDKINATVSALENEVALIKNDLKTASSEMNKLKNSVSSLNKDVEEGKSSLEVFRKKTEEDHRKLELQLLNYEVYQRRENLRFYGIREEGTDENTKETLYNFFETELGIEDARRIEFQRVHRVEKEKRNPREPRAIIAVLRYPPLEDESGFGIRPDLPKQVVEMRKKLIPKMLEAGKQGKRAAFSRSEPYKLLIDGLQYT